MKKRATLEADLDPRGTRHTRPGSKTAKQARALAKGVPARKTARKPTRPGAYAAERVHARIRRERSAA